MVDTPPPAIKAQLAASKDAQRRGQFDTMLEAAENACKLEPSNVHARFRLLECLLYCGQVNRVLDELVRIEEQSAENHRLLCQAAEYYTHCADHESALRCYRRAVALQPHNPEYLFALAAAEIANGDLGEAEIHLSDVIKLNPHDYDAYRNRATLKKQRPDNNHIAEMESLLEQGIKEPAGEAQLCYALAKEYEDLADDDKAFEYLARGAAKRRSIMAYRVEGDVAVMARLRRVFDQDLMSLAPAGCEETGPIFVMGLPRSGTTLIDRILSSHSQVESLGEINNFAYSLMHTIGRSGDKLELIDLSAQIDFNTLGQRYIDSLRAYRRPSHYLIDKTPLNYLYIGLIHLALPNARIMHVHRKPMDSCYAMYRTLFRAGYPFSYNFDDLGKYYVAYRQLMDHWSAVAPQGFLDISYESLVYDQERVSRDIIEYCGLNWEQACLNFHQNTATVATASSAQVRRPLYRDAVQRWRRYEQQLQPLVRYLQREGIDTDAT